VYVELRKRILPALISEANARHTELRVWSAGCATGEEPYSLAILFLPLLHERAATSVRIFATDIDGDAVAFARRGAYPASKVRRLPRSFLDRYCTRLDGAYRVRRAVRDLIVFGQHDLATQAQFGHVDLVLCRNVLIYFAPALQRKVLQLLACALRPGGYLVLGKAETASQNPDWFAVDNARLKVYRRQDQYVPIPPAWRPNDNGDC
jgi:two-component system CheB/CheR fusion protein